MKCEILNGKLIVTMDLQKPSPSKSAKTLIVATTHGAMVSTAQVDGKPVIVSVNAYIKP